jgi:hypothetical protein
MSDTTLTNEVLEVRELVAGEWVQPDLSALVGRPFGEALWEIGKRDAVMKVSGEAAGIPFTCYAASTEKLAATIRRRSDTGKHRQKIIVTTTHDLLTRLSARKSPILDDLMPEVGLVARVFPGATLEGVHSVK